MPRPANRDAAPDPTETIFIVDDDDALRRGMEFLVTAAGYDVQSFDSARAFLEGYPPDAPGCLLLDMRMPGMGGLELLEHLRNRNIDIPVIFVTAFGNIPMAVRALKAGAFDFIEKPFEGSELLDRVRKALALEDRARAYTQQIRELRGRMDTLTPREREVMELVVTGMLNKQIAAELGISMKTVENHRAQVMEKMQAVSLAELVRMVLAVDPDL